MVNSFTMSPKQWFQATLLAGAAVLTACGGSSGGAGAVPDTVPPPLAGVVPSPVQLQASQSGELLAYVQARLTAQINQGLSSNGANAVALGGTVSPAFSASTVAGATAEATPAFASTTLQEGGVDEADLMKTDGARIFTLGVAAPGGSSLSALKTYVRQINGDAVLASQLALPVGYRFEGMHLSANGSQIALVGQTQATGLAFSPDGFTVTTFAPSTYAPPQTIVQQVSAVAGLPLATSRTLVIEGQLIDTRTIDNTLYVVTSWFPRFDTIYPATGATVAERKDAIARVSLAQVLPSVTVTTGLNGLGTPPVKQALLADTDCHVQAANASSAVQLTTVTAINLASPNLERSSRCLLGGVNSIYMSAKNLYLATSRYSVLTAGSGQSPSLVYPGLPITDIHKFAVNAMTVSYRGSGEVAGHLGWDASKTAYRMSEYQNDLRVVTYANNLGWWGEPNRVTKGSIASPAQLTVLREDTATGQLKTLATLPNASRPAPIGLAGEQIYAVRFVADRAYVVTFRRIDPLYVLDLTNPADPKQVGELKTNGYSDFLLPVGAAGAGLLLGVGKDATDAGIVQGVKVSLFDVSNPAAPAELASRVLGKAGSLSGLDYSRHGVNVFNVGNVTRVALPVRLSDTLVPGSVFYRASAHNLARFEVDTILKTLTDKPSLPGQTFATENAAYQASSLGFERSVQIGGQIYYLGSQGSLTASGW